MSATLTFDTRQFSQAMKEYQEATKKDAAYVINRQVKNWAIKAGTIMKQADKTTIKNLESKEHWPAWPRYIAARLSKKLSMAVGASKYSSSFAMRVKKNRGKDKVGTHMVSDWSRQARQLSKRIIAQRTGAITFLRVFFFVIGERITKALKGGDNVPAMQGKKSWFACSVDPATETKMTCSFSSLYNYKHHDASSATKAEVLLQRASDLALQQTIDDMKNFAAEKMAAAARKVSAK